MHEGSLVVVLVSDPAPGAGADEHDTLVQAQAVGDALERLGHRVATLAFAGDVAALAERLAALAPALVFNLVESIAGSGRLAYLAPALLDAMGVPFCGCGPAALLTTGDKLLCKRIMLGARIPTPRWIEGRAPGRTVRRGERMIVKPVFEDASLGIDAQSVVSSARALNARLEQRMRTLGGAWFAEQFIDGREFNVSLIAAADGVEVLPVAEIRFDDFPAGVPRIVDYAAKWQPESFAYRHTPRCFDFPDSDEPIIARVSELALRCWRVFGLRGYARVDLRVDSTSAAWVLEVNGNPCLSPDAGFTAAAARAGLDYASVIRRIVTEAGASAVAAAA